MKNVLIVLCIGMLFVLGCSENAPFDPNDDVLKKAPENALMEKISKPLPKMIGHTIEFFSPQTLP